SPAASRRRSTWPRAGRCRRRRSARSWRSRWDEGQIRRYAVGEQSPQRVDVHVFGDEVAERVQSSRSDVGERDLTGDVPASALGGDGGQERTPEPVALQHPVPGGTAHRAERAPAEELLTAGGRDDAVV